MPTYEYICKDCGERFEHFQSMSSPPLEQHSSCEKEGSDVERVISGGTGLIFKGSGFYLTDYKKADAKGTDKKVDSNKKSEKKELTKKTKQTKMTGKESI